MVNDSARIFRRIRRNMKHGNSHEIIASNIDQMVKDGHPVKKAVAASLAHARRSQMQDTKGSMSNDPEIGNIGGGDDNAYAGSAEYSEDQSINSGLSPITESESKLAEGLQSMKTKANNNSVSYSAGSDAPTGVIKSEGLTVDEGHPLGNKPSAPMPGMTGEPMSEVAKAAIMAKKAKRKFS